MIQTGTRVLFISPKTFDYEKEIKAELERAGCSVDWYDDRPGSSPLIKALIRFRPKMIKTLTDAYYERIIKQVRTRTYDVVFVIKAEALPIDTLRLLRQCQPGARFLYYSWDAMQNFPDSRAKLAHFDKAYSFDRFDCAGNDKVKHLPLFYIRAYESLATPGRAGERRDIDLLFLGSIHSDRYAVVQRIWRASKGAVAGSNLYAYFFYQSRWVFALRKLGDRHFRAIPWSDVRWQSLDAGKTLSLVTRSSILIDVHHPGQTGLTMRSIESLGAQRKIITTNPEVMQYDFYRPENILVVDRLAPHVTPAFLEAPYQALAPELYAKYSLRSWLAEIFS